MSDKKPSKENPEKGNANKEKDLLNEAHTQAEKDIETDPDLHTNPEPGDDLDEGELARLEGED